MGKRTRPNLKEILSQVSVLALDSAPLIHYLEGQSKLAQVFEPFFVAIEKGVIKGVISTVVFHEVMIKPLRQGNRELVTGYRRLFNSFPNLYVVPVDLKVAEKASELRVNYPSIRAPDAFHIATALIANADLLITGDKRLQKVKELPIIALG